MRHNPFDSSICVVTGGGSGIGKAICKQLVAQGAMVVNMDVKHGNMSPVMDDQISSMELVTLDVRDANAVNERFEEVLKKYKHVDYLFNCAGINILGEFTDLSLEDWQQIFQVNVWGVLHTCQTLYPLMVHRGKGHIVNVASGLGLTPAPRNSAYAASKFAVVGLSESLRIEGADLHVKVSTVCPGWIKTPMLEHGRVAGRGKDHIRIGDVAGHMPFGFADVDRTAEQILKGVRRGQVFIFYPWYVRAFVWVYRLVRPLSDWWNREEIRGFRRQSKL